jgi:polysaccharide export outer membrane protein
MRIGMTISWRGTGFLAISLCTLSACEPELHSRLPQGAGAYNAVAVSETDTVNALVLLQPRDQIDVNVFQEKDLTTQNAVIDQAGNVSLPLIGQVHAAGLSLEQLGTKVQQAYKAAYLKDPHVNVVLVKGAPRVVSVEGEVKNPGVFEVQQGYTLLSALAMAGSPIETAKQDEVLIFREKDGQRVGGRFNITDIRSGRSPDPLVLPGDVIVVGYSRVRGLYLDFLKTAPIIGAFARY